MYSLDKNKSLLTRFQHRRNKKLFLLLSTLLCFRIPVCLYTKGSRHMHTKSYPEVGNGSSTSGASSSNRSAPCWPYLSGKAARASNNAFAPFRSASQWWTWRVCLKYKLVIWMIRRNSNIWMVSPSMISELLLVNQVWHCWKAECTFILQRMKVDEKGNVIRLGHLLHNSTAPSKTTIEPKNWGRDFSMGQICFRQWQM